MSLRRTALIFGRELAHSARRPLFLVWLVLLLFMTWGLSSGKVRIQTGDSSVGGVKAFLTSEFAVTQQFLILVPMIYGFFVSVVAGMAVIQDDEHRIGELLHATPLRPSEYVWGKFLAALAVSVVVLALHVVAMVLINHATPAGDAREYRGPLLVANYVRPALLFALPTLVFFAGVSFAVGEGTRKPVLVFFLPVAVLLGCAFFLWNWSPTWLDPRVDRLLALVDPAGFRWFNETLIKVDRGVHFYNSAPVPLDGWIVANRLLMLSLGLGAVAWSRAHLASTLRGRSPRPGRLRRSRVAEVVEPSETGPSSRPLSELGMTGRRPGLLSGAWAVFRAEATELRSSPALYLFVPLLVLESVGPNLLAVGAFDTPMLLTPGTFASRSLNPLTVMLCLLLLFTTVESFWRERNAGLASISLATPVRSVSVLLGKAGGIALVATIVVVMEMIAAAGMLIYQRKVGLDPRPFALLWGGLLGPTILLWTAFVMATLAITRNRYATYGIALAVLMFTGYRTVTGEINWVGNWPLWSAVTWSDMSVLEFDRSALLLNRVFALGLAAFLIALTIRLDPRREPDPAGIARRLRPPELFKSALRLSPIAAIPLVAGLVLYSRVEGGYEGKSAKNLGKDYWRKNLATYVDQPNPDLAAVDLALTLDPARSGIKASGTYDLVNNTEKPLREIALTGGLHWRSPRWTLDGKEVTPTNRSGLFVFNPSPPLPPGGKVRIGFAFSGTFPGGVSRKGGGTREFILPSGVVLTSFGTSFAPRVGFTEEVGVDEENRYESKEYPDDHYVGQTESAFGPRRPFTTRVAVTGPEGLRYNSVGTLKSETVKDGLRTAVWESEEPVNFFNVVAGRWEVKRGQGTAVYYHRGHAYNVDAMVEALDSARRYYSEWFHPYPWRELKLSEFPALAGYAQGFPTDITFSESIGFLSSNDPKTQAPFVITAHESAHQWWGNIVTPGKGPGGNLVSEGTSHFSTLLLLEKVKGVNARIAFATKIEDDYTKARSSDSERPLVKIDGSRDGDTTVTYDKTGFVLWMLLNHVGREPMMAGLREFFRVYHANPDHPVLEDLLAVLRPFAADPTAFDEFTRQWFFRVVVPEYQLASVKSSRDGEGWVVDARLTNAGTGTMPVEVAAVRGERFKPDGSTDPAYSEARQTVTVDAGKTVDVRIPCPFEPKEVVVDPDVKVLMLRRKAARASL